MTNSLGKKHIEPIETKLSAASGAIYKLRKYIPQKVLMSVYYSQTRRHEGAYRGRAPQMTACAPPNENCAPPSEDCAPKKINRIGATAVQI